jgi:GAF domain-containing protein
MTATLDDEVAELRRACTQLQQRLDEAIAREATTAEVLKESLEYQTATSDVLKVISQSTFGLQPVLDTLVETAARLCNADASHVVTRDGDAYKAVAIFAYTPEYAAFVRERSFKPGRGSITERTLLERGVIHVADIAADPEYALPESLSLGLTRTALGVPMLREGEIIGVLGLGRRRVEPFTERQIELVRTFAAQAVIAIENARLLTETREALEQQTATAEVLQVINSSPGDLAPVFDAMLEKATRLAEASFGILMTYDGESFYTVGLHNVPQAFAEYLRAPIFPGPLNGLGRLLSGERLIHLADITADTAYAKGDPLRKATAELGGSRTQLLVPLLKEGRLLGTFVIYRQEVRPFFEKQITLVKNFAQQAVIAMENARLITETREALDQQTATAEVLQVINSSPGDLAPVFDTVVEKATRLCGAAYGHQHMFDGESFRIVAAHGDERFVHRIREVGGIRAEDTITFERILVGESVVHISDVSKDIAYRSGKSGAVDAVEVGGVRTLATVALRKDEKLLGTISIYRQEVRPFSDKQIALLQNFAAQAVIAMENARLLTETREALEQQTATAEVLEVINSSPGNLTPVFDAMLEKAMRLSGRSSASFLSPRPSDCVLLQFGEYQPPSPSSDFVILPRLYREASPPASSPANPLSMSPM